MACGSTCKSNCYTEDQDILETIGKKGGKSNNGFSNIHGESICSKCKSEPSLKSYKGYDVSVCTGCFRSSLFSKFKFAVTSHGMIFPTDNILVAVSGGPASRVALQFVHEIHYKAQKDFEASKDKSLPVFGVGVAFVDESSTSLISTNVVETTIQQIKSTLLTLSPPEKKLHVIPIENIYNLNSENRSKLVGLLGTVNDLTGKEDLVQHLRMLALQKVAIDNGYNKVVLGLCTSKIASHVLSATVKGKGYSLSADVQYVDARWEIPVVFPLHDCLAQELTMLCHLDGLETQEPYDIQRSSINSLVSSFVAFLQEENPSRERTIVRTAEKLIPFGFNKLPDNHYSERQFPSRVRRKVQDLRRSESIASEVLCPICNSPINTCDFPNLSSQDCYDDNDDPIEDNCCSSCLFQIVPKDNLSRKLFSSFLPHTIGEKFKRIVSLQNSCIRDQIKDCLLSDEDDVN